MKQKNHREEKGREETQGRDSNSLASRPAALRSLLNTAVFLGVLGGRHATASAASPSKPAAALKKLVLPVLADPPSQAPTGRPYLGVAALLQSVPQFIKRQAFKDAEAAFLAIDKFRPAYRKSLSLGAQGQNGRAAGSTEGEKTSGKTGGGKDNDKPASAPPAVTTGGEESVEVNLEGLPWAEALEAAKLGQVCVARSRTTMQPAFLPELPIDRQIERAVRGEDLIIDLQVALALLGVALERRNIPALMELQERGLRLLSLIADLKVEEFPYLLSSSPPFDRLPRLAGRAVVDLLFRRQGSAPLATILVPRAPDKSSSDGANKNGASKGKQLPKTVASRFPGITTLPPSAGTVNNETVGTVGQEGTESEGLLDQSESNITRYIETDDPNFIANVTIIVDGYTAPFTAGNFLELADRGFYNNLALQVESVDADAAAPAPLQQTSLNRLLDPSQPQPVALGALEGGLPGALDGQLMGGGNVTGALRRNETAAGSDSSSVSSAEGSVSSSSSSSSLGSGGNSSDSDREKDRETLAARSRYGSPTQREFDVVQMGRYREGFVDPSTGKVRNIPLEVVRKKTPASLAQQQAERRRGADPVVPYTPVYGNANFLKETMELRPLASFETQGAVAMNHPRGRPNGGSSEFFWLKTPEPVAAGGDRVPNASVLDGKYAIFGYVVSGLDVLNSKVQDGDFLDRVVIREGLASLLKPKPPSLVQLFSGLSEGKDDEKEPSASKPPPPPDVNNEPFSTNRIPPAGEGQRAPGASSARTSSLPS